MTDNPLVQLNENLAIKDCSLGIDLYRRDVHPHGDRWSFDTHLDTEDVADIVDHFRDEFPEVREPEDD